MIARNYILILEDNFECLQCDTTAVKKELSKPTSGAALQGCQ